MCSGRSFHVVCIFPFVMLCLPAWSIMFLVYMLVGGDVSEKAVCVFCELCTAFFLVICECSPVLLKFILFCDDVSDLT